MNKKSFNLYKSWSPMIINMDSTQAGKLFQAVYRYQEDGSEPEPTSAIYPFFCLMKAKFDEDDEAYKEKCEKNKSVAIERESTKRHQTCTNVHDTAPECTKQHQTAPECTDTDTDTDIDTDIDKEIGTRKRGPFTPPTTEEVKAYCQERKNNVDAERFVDFYTQKGWVVGRSNTKMKDWKAAVRLWEKTEIRETARSGTTRQSKIQGQDYDLDELERLLVKN